MKNKMKVRDIRADVVKRWTVVEKGITRRKEELSCGHVIDVSHLQKGITERNCPRCREQRLGTAAATTSDS